MDFCLTIFYSWAPQENEAIIYSKLYSIWTKWRCISSMLWLVNNFLILINLNCYGQAYSIFFTRNGMCILTSGDWLMEKPYWIILIWTKQVHNFFYSYRHAKINIVFIINTIIIVSLSYWEVLLAYFNRCSVIDWLSPTNYIIAVNTYLLPTNYGLHRNGNSSTFYFIRLWKQSFFFPELSTPTLNRITASDQYVSYMLE